MIVVATFALVTVLAATVPGAPAVLEGAFRPGVLMVSVRLAGQGDGSRIVFRSERDGNSEIYLMEADGSGQRNLTRHPGHEAWPSWSNHGDHIAFVSDRDGTSELWVMAGDGSSPHRLSALKVRAGFPAVVTGRRDDRLRGRRGW